jgi:hypothetical protein
LSEHGFLKGRALDLLRLDPPVRRIVLTTGVVLAMVALACAVREDFPGPVFRLPDGYVIPLVVMLIAGATATFAMTQLIAGAAHARTRWRYTLLIPLALGVSAVTLAAVNTVTHDWPQEAEWAVLAAALLLPAIFLAIAAFLGPRFRAVQMFWAVLAFMAACALAIILISILITPDFGASVILYLVGVGAVALEPALLVVGFDLADIGADAAGLGAGFVEKQNAIVQRIARIAALVLVLVAAGALFVWTGFSHMEMFLCAGWFVAILAVFALTVRLARRRVLAPASAASPQYHHLLLFTAAVTLVSLIISFSSEPLPGLFSESGLRSYSFAEPQGLEEFGEPLPAAGHMADPRSPTRVMFAGKDGWPLLVVVGVPRPPFAKPEDHFSSVNGMIHRMDMPKMPVPAAEAPANGWAHAEDQTKDKAGHVFGFVVLHREVASDDVATDMNWYIICGDTKAAIATSRTRCNTIASSFLAQERKRTSRSLAVIFDILFFAAAIATLGLAAWRSNKEDTAGYDFLFWALFLNGLRGIMGYAGEGLDNVFYDNVVSGLLICAMLAAIGVIALMAEVWPVSRGFDIAAARRIAARAGASMLIVAGLFVLYVFAIRGSDESQIIRGVIICFALLWELAMSGERLNLTAEHHFFPRSSRVFILIGYLLLVATVVFLMTGLVTYKGEAVGWNSELFVANGIALLGGAIIFSRAMRGFARRTPDAH